MDLQALLKASTSTSTTGIESEGETLRRLGEEFKKKTRELGEDLLLRDAVRGGGVESNRVKSMPAIK